MYTEFIDEITIDQFLIPCGLLGYEDTEQMEQMRCDNTIYDIVRIWSDGESSDYTE